MHRRIERRDPKPSPSSELSEPEIRPSPVALFRRTLKATIRLVPASGLLLIGVAAFQPTALADEGEGIKVTIDLEKGKASPEAPTVNGWLPDAAVFMELTGKKGHEFTGYPDVAQYELICTKVGANKLAGCEGHWGLELVDEAVGRDGRQMTMRVAACSNRAFKKHGLGKGHESKCPFVVFRPGVPESSPSWTLFSNAGVVVWTFDVYDPSKPGEIIAGEFVPCVEASSTEDKECFEPVIKDGKAILVPCPKPDPDCVDGKKEPRDSRGMLVSSYSLPVHIARKPFALRWSAGFGFPSISNERYRLEPVPAVTGTSDMTGDMGDEMMSTSDMASLRRVSSEENLYQLAAFAHWVPLAADSFAITAGLSTDVPIEDLTVMVGGSVQLRTWPIKNGVFLTVGLAYVLEDHLKPAYQGLETVPASLKAEELVEGEGEFKFFAGLSFGFWGSKDKFSGVLSGNK